MCDEFDLNLEQGDDNLFETYGESSFETPTEVNPISTIEMDPTPIDGIPTELDLTGGQNVVEIPSEEFAQANVNFNSTFAESANNVDDTHLEYDSSLDDLEKIKQDLDDELRVSDEELSHLQHRAEGIEREDHHDGISFKGVKICATRHGCTGATNCDYSMSGPVGR